jgi:hypothetical protein
MDEFAMQHPDVWNLVLRPTLSDHQGSAMFIGTPDGTQNWSYDLYQRGMSGEDPQWKSFLYTTLDGGNVPEWEIEQARKDLDERSFRQEYLATFETYAGQIYYNFDRKVNIKPWNKPIPTTVHIGMDFNVGVMSGVCFAIEGNVCHAFDEIMITSSNTTEMVEEIRNRFPMQNIVVYPDPAGAARKTSAGGVTDHRILQNAGFTLKAPRAHNPVRDGINAVNSKLLSADKVSTMFVDPKCKKTIESLDKHIYKQGTSVPDKDSGYDHASDALRYFVDYVYPIKRIVDTSLVQPTRWGVRSGDR